jgi:hypothetical protein
MSPDSFQSIGWLLLAGAGLAGALNQGLTLLDRWKEKPSASEVAAEAARRFVTTDVCAASHTNFVQRLSALETSHSQLEKRIDSSLTGIRAEMSDMERRLNRNDEERTQKIHDRLNDILRCVGELSGEVHAK